MQGWIVVATAVVYLIFLFAIASYGDRAARLSGGRPGNANIYALSLGIYCTSWTFFGSVGLAASEGLEFLTIYIGAGGMILFGYPLLRRIITVAKAQNITSIADFMSARFGKSIMVGAFVTAIAVLGSVPYIALQLKAVSLSLTTMLGHLQVSMPDIAIEGLPPVFGDLALLVALALAAFSILFGTRQIDATEHQHGLMLAIAAESVIKLAAFLTVGLFVTFIMFSGPADLFAQASANPEISGLFNRNLDGGTWLAMIFLSLVCVVLLPRQFHVTVVENNHPEDLRRARWMFPTYLVAINIFVVPIAAAGLLLLDGDGVDADMFVLLLPMQAGADWVTLLAFIGGLSAATAMVIVAAVALSVMISNELVMPLMLRRRAPAAIEAEDMGALILFIRRCAILIILLLAYAYYRLQGSGAALASTGLLSFSAIAQLAPAFFGGLFWRRATAPGAVAGMAAGIAMWAYTLLLPALARAGVVPDGILTEGLFGLALLKPETLFTLEFDPLTHSVLWSMTVNVTAFITVSLLRPPEPVERLQAGIFVPADRVPIATGLRRWRSSVTVAALKNAVARYLGEERCERAFAEHAAKRGGPLDPDAVADVATLTFAEKLLASAIGAASSRIVLSLLLKRETVSPKAALKLLDDASTAIQHNRDLLQTALDQVGQGIAVFNRDLQLICWNRQFRELLRLPPELGIVGVPLSAILTHSAEAGEFGGAPIAALVDARIARITGPERNFLERFERAGLILEIRTNPMPDGGVVVSYLDVTDRISAQDALARANETLERRVVERTQELTRLNAALVQAKSDAETANVSKTRFLAAASHDVMQPLNAARLYVSTLAERPVATEDRRLVDNVDQSLEAAEEILGALLEISKLDAGAMRAEKSSFRLDEVLDQLRVEFAPMAEAKGIDLAIVGSSVMVRSDRRLLRRVLQNLVSNAIKYTDRGRILVGCRRHGRSLTVAVYDTGPGIPLAKQGLIFKEFQRLDDHRGEPGLGLGLSIVERMCSVLDHRLTLTSAPGRGSKFAIEVPAIPAAAPNTVAAAAAAVAARPDTLAGLVVLCIDNEQRILDGMEALLTGWGCTVLKALDAREAVKRARQSDQPVDLALADYHLNDGTGIEAVVQLRWKVDAALPAILITADRTKRVVEEAQGKGLGVLHKPVKPAALRALMTQFRPQRDAAE